jgi:ankyrin repeat protein
MIDFIEYDKKNVNGAQEPWRHYDLRNLTGAVFHGDVKRVEEILALKVGKQDIEETEGGIGFWCVSMTPLGIAASKSDMVLVDMLLEHHANPNGTGVPEDYYTATPLVAAVKTNSIEIVKLLLEKGAAINSIASTHPDTLGVTAMCVAAKKNLVPMAVLLLENGADINLKSGNGATPLDIAKEYHSVGMIEWLSSNKGKPSVRGTNINATTLAQEICSNIFKSVLK